MAQANQYLGKDVLNVPAHTAGSENRGVGKAVNHAEVTATI